MNIQLQVQLTNYAVNHEGVHSVQPWVCVKVAVHKEITVESENDWNLVYIFFRPWSINVALSTQMLK